MHARCPIIVKTCRRNRIKNCLGSTITSYTNTIPVFVSRRGSSLPIRFEISRHADGTNSAAESFRARIHVPVGPAVWTLTMA